MDWLTHNFIGDMYGPDFLAFYAFVILATIVTCKSAIGQAVRGGHEQPGRARLVPTDPDPYEIAYLRGGVNEVIRLAIYELLHGRWIEEHGAAKKLAVDSGKPGADRLPPIQRAVLRAFQSPHYAHEVFRTGAVDEVAILSRGYDEDLRRAGFLVSPEMADKARHVRNAGLLVILLLGGYKLAAALANGHANVGFLIVFALIGTTINMAANRTPRLTEAGRSYLGRLQAALGPLKSRRDFDERSDRELALLVGLFGFVVLAGTPEAAYARMFGQSASSGGCGSGGGCSSGSCGGGGGGGGCGGCGGGD